MPHNVAPFRRRPVQTHATVRLRLDQSFIRRLDEAAEAADTTRERFAEHLMRHALLDPDLSSLTITWLRDDG